MIFYVKRFLISFLILMAFVPTTFAAISLAPLDESGKIIDSYVFVFDVFDDTDLTKLTGDVLITNTSDEVLFLAFDGVDSGYSSADGSLYFEQIEETKDSVGKWIYPNLTSISISPNENSTVSFKLSPPEDLAYGEYVGAFIAYNVPDVSEGTGLSVISRQAVKVQVNRVEGNENPSEDVGIVDDMGSDVGDSYNIMLFVIVVLILSLLYNLHLRSQVKSNRSKKRRK